MSWNKNTSEARVKKHLEGMGEIEIEKLVRDADLHSLLSETCCRDIYGAHVYVDVPNFVDLTTVAADGEEYRRIIQAIHLYEREVARIVENEEHFGGVRIHFQGAKLHALFFRPIDDSKEIAVRSVLLQMVLRHFARYVFNSEFPKLPNLTLSGGADLGFAIGTKNGRRGDRELLFLGAPANYAAKILTGTNALRVTSAVYEALPEALQEYLTTVHDDRYDVDVYDIGAVSAEELRSLLGEYGIEWNCEDSRERLKDDKLTFPLNSIEYSDAEVLMDIDSLGIKNNKRVMAGSVFGDVSGFTAYIDQAVKDDKAKEALRVLHAIRKEMAAVVQDDFSGLRVQFQGDRVQALFHLPKGDEKKIAIRAVETAVGLQSSMDLVLKKVLPEAKDLGIAVGSALGTTLVSKLGTHGHRDRICIGEAVEVAARYQEASAGGEIAVPAHIYDYLAKEVQDFFKFSKARGAYVAVGLTQDKVELALKAALYKQAVHVTSTAVGARITGESSGGGRSFVPSRSYAE